jgi:2-dehydropantoate 2-reductase
MNDATPIIAVVGAGAVGGYYGGRLAQHGHRVHFLLRGDYDAVRRNGLAVQSPDGNFRLAPGEVNVYDDVRRMPKADLVIVTLKSTSNNQLDPLVCPLLKEDTAVLTLQNGLGNEDLLAELFGARRVLGGMAFVCINRVGPGVIRHIDYGFIRMGEFAGPGRSARSERIAAMFNASRVKCELLDDLRYGRWQKLLWNPVQRSGRHARPDDRPGDRQRRGNAAGARADRRSDRRRPRRRGQPSRRAD